MKSRGILRGTPALLALGLVLLTSCGLPQGRGSTGGSPESQLSPTPSPISAPPSSSMTTTPAPFTGDPTNYQAIGVAPAGAAPAVTLDWLLDGVDPSLNRVYLTATVPACNRPLQAIVTEDPHRVVLTLAGVKPTPGIVCPHNVAIFHGYVQLQDPIGNRTFAPAPAG